MLRTAGRGLALAMALNLIGAGAAFAADDADRTPSAPALTAKERLTSKARDEQRVNDCKVPLAARGDSQRPAACSRKPSR